MEKRYGKEYFYSENGGVKYTDSGGQQKEFGYRQGGLWNFQPFLDKLIELLGLPESIIDAGSGCGGLIATVNKNGVKGTGLEFSQFAIDHAIMDAKKFLVKCDVEQPPWPVEQHDWVTAIDLCFAEGTLVMRDEGITSIEEINVGDLVFTHTGNMLPVTRTYKRAYQGNLIHLKARFFGDTYLTPNHPVLVIRNSYGSYRSWRLSIQQNKPLKADWYPVEQLETNDVLLFPIEKTVNDTQSIKISDYCINGERTSKCKEALQMQSIGLKPKAISDRIGINEVTVRKWLHGQNPKDSFILDGNYIYWPIRPERRIQNNIPIEDDFLWLLGLFFADGSVSGNCTYFYIGENERDILSRTEQILRNLFGITWYKEIKRKGRIQLNVPSKALALLFKKIVGENALAHTKKLPKWIMLLPIEKQIHLLRGLWDGDGNVGAKGFAYTTVSKNLAYQIRTLLSRQSIVASMGLYSIKGGFIGYKSRPQYQLHVAGAFLQKMSEVLDCIHPYLKKRSLSKQHVYMDDKYIYLPITEISTQEYKGYVYNLEVEKDHSYTTSGLCAHNCEHLFDDRIDQVIAEAKKKAKKYIIAKICTAQHPREVWAAKRATYEQIIEQAKKEDFEWLIASGHVNSQVPKYWVDKFVDSEWKLREDLSERLKRELRLPEDWRTTIIIENITNKEDEVKSPLPITFTSNYYDENYFAKPKGKKYRKNNGLLDGWSYNNPTGEYLGCKDIVKAWKTVFNPNKMLDVGCGKATFITYARDFGINAVGFDYSEYAINNPYPRCQKEWIQQHDATKPWPYIDGYFDFVTVLDFYEHIYMEDIPFIIKEMFRAANKYIFIQTAVAGNNDKEYMLEKGKPVPLEYEKYAAAGHLTLLKESKWEELLDNPDWTRRRDLEAYFKASVPKEAISNWLQNSIIVLEKTV